MYAFNEKKVFCDAADDQLIILNFETGAYYAFNALAAAVVHDLVAGCRPGDIRQALYKLAPSAVVDEQFDRLIEDMLKKELLVVLTDAAPARQALSSYDQLLSGDGFSLHMDEFMDVADLLLMDPIHEVDPAAGWPEVKPADDHA